MKPASSNHSVKSSANHFPELIIPYIYFNHLKVLTKYFEYSRKQYLYLLTNFTNTLFLTFYCKNALARHVATVYTTADSPVGVS